MNLNLSLELLDSLYKLGVREVCLCPGGRNAPLIKALQKFQKFEVFSFFDERAAGFFALGASLRSHRPTAVITTSGTAAANLLPACIEAFYSQVPLVLVTADRPKTFRGSGSPQSIEQVGIFSHYVEKTWDIDVNQKVELADFQRPIHINICFDEPLLSESVPQNSDCKERVLAENLSALEEGKSPDEKTFNASAFKKPLVILGPGPIPDFCLTILADLKLPIYCEAPSGHRENLLISDCCIRGGEHFLSREKFCENFDSVIRLGGVPTLKLWRDLESHLANTPIVNFTRQTFSGLARDKRNFFSFSAFSDFVNLLPSGREKNVEVVAESREYYRELEINWRSKLSSELAFVHQFSQWLPVGAKVFVGNSLAIRDWDIAATHDPKGLQIGCNRGANGIDGLISTALGWADKSQPTFCLVGDLSALYDLNALHALSQRPTPFHLVILNNGGGKIFRSIFSDPMFENSHNYDFEALAKMFNLNYLRVEQEFPKVDFNGCSVVELKIPTSE